MLTKFTEWVNLGAESFTNSVELLANSSESLGNSSELPANSTELPANAAELQVAVAEELIPYPVIWCLFYFCNNCNQKEAVR
jgi:hypothetical protein